MSSRRSRACPNCGQRFTGQRAYIHHLLVEAGPDGVTTNQLMAFGAGSRYSARILELRDQGMTIESVKVTEGNWRYTLVGAGVRTSAPAPTAWHGLPAGMVDGPEVPLERTWKCLTCGADADGPICPRGHQATECITVDLRPATVRAKVAEFTERRTAA